jgi:hypothetical protein
VRTEGTVRKKKKKREKQSNLHVLIDLKYRGMVSSRSRINLSSSAMIVMERVWLLGEQKGLWKKKGAIFEREQEL